MHLLIVAIAILLPGTALAQIPKMPSLPSSSGGKMGLQGAVGAGFADYRIQWPSRDFKMDRGIFVAGQIERGFNVLHLYLTLTLQHMQAEGLANYEYSNLSNSTTFTATDVKFKSQVTDLALGLKFKLIDEYWFRPYVEGGGLAGYHQVQYTNKADVLSAQGTDYKNRDVVMGSGYYGEAGIEAMFAQSFGVKLAARSSVYQTKKLETLANRPLRFSSETYYFALLFGM
jgi:hypothetical protein